MAAPLRHANIDPNEDSRFYFAFKGAPGREYSSIWVPALRGLDGKEHSSLFMYGQLFGSLNIAVAYRHILENPYRSEFIRVLAETLKILAHLGDPLPNLIATQYPDVARLIEHPSAPVVLELCGITQNRLLRENGASNIEVELMLLDDMQENPGMFVPLSFRIADVTPDDIVAVHDLSAWSIGDDLNAMWSPEASKVAEVRQPPTRWLADAKID